jgi:hypothetical protein
MSENAISPVFWRDVPVVEICSLCVVVDFVGVGFFVVVSVGFSVGAVIAALWVGACVAGRVVIYSVASSVVEREEISSDLPQEHTEKINKKHNISDKNLFIGTKPSFLIEYIINCTIMQIKTAKIFLQLIYINSIIIVNKCL